MGLRRRPRDQRLLARRECLRRRLQGLALRSPLVPSTLPFWRPSPRVYCDRLRQPFDAEHVRQLRVTGQRLVPPPPGGIGIPNRDVLIVKSGGWKGIPAWYREDDRKDRARADRGNARPHEVLMDRR